MAQVTLSARNPGGILSLNSYTAGMDDCTRYDALRLA
jgi:hypothetical protein